MMMDYQLSRIRSVFPVWEIYTKPFNLNSLVNSILALLPAGGSVFAFN
jgi:hypothetical protein